MARKTHTPYTIYNAPIVRAVVRAELKKLVDDGKNIPLTRLQLLIRRLMDGSLEGRADMLHNLHYLLSSLCEEKKEYTGVDYNIMFRFYARYKSLIDAEIEKRREKDPINWTFDYSDMKPEDTPWYQL